MTTHVLRLAAVSVLALSTGGTPSAAQAPATVQVAAAEEILVTARRREESLQDVPIAVTVLAADLVADANAFNVNRIKELIPTLQFYSTNPRNSAINIRGLGAPFGLTNDGIEPGVGLYIDGVFFARPAAATLDFVDIERIEVLRGPQGTLYGKNTTAGAINVTTRRPSFSPEASFELSYGNIGFLQAKASVSGPLVGEKIAARLSFSGTRRDGVLFNVRTQDDLNDLNNLGVRSQLLAVPSENLEIVISGDVTRQRPEGYAQVVAGVTPTLRPANRQFAAIIADLQYRPPSFNGFDRVTDTDTPWRSNQELGGLAVNLDWETGAGTLTSISAWRFWNWDPSNDRDFLGLPITTVSAAPSKQRQWTQEIRFDGRISDTLSYVVGAFGFKQTIDSAPTQRQEQGAAAARFLLAPSAAAATPGLLDGYGQDLLIDFDNSSAALFGQLEWRATDRLRLLGGARLNYDKKTVDYVGSIYGGLRTTNPALITLQRSILAPQAYAADVADTNLSGQVTVGYDIAADVNAYATYSTSFKSVGLNLAGVPTNAAGQPALEAAVVRPEDVAHVEIGLKTRPFATSTLNVSAYWTNVRDFQAQVVNASVGVLRGYLSNAEKVRVRGIEIDGSLQWRDFTFWGAGAYADGTYVSFRDAPPPLELTGGPQVVDISGGRLPGLSKWAASLGTEYTVPATFLGRDGEFLLGADASYRSSFSSSATPSAVLNVPSYALLNVRAGFRTENGWEVSVWSRNLTDTKYYELLSAAAGGTGLFVGQPGDPRTFGVTLRGKF
jgi:iron complex outermembrane receptor protein